MASLPQPQHALSAAVYRWWQDHADDGLRPHLGASLIGHPCARHLWLTFRWAINATWEGRMLRLFHRGQREEAILVMELRGIGAEVSEGPAPGEQWRVSACGGHVGGSLDGVARGIPGGSSQHWELLEFKTHNAKSFKELTDKGVKTAKRQHWAQMQIYLALTGMTRANYIAVCKDDDSIYHERVHADPDEGQALLQRAESVVFAPEPPPRISQDPSWFQCYGCQHHGLCHGATVPLVHCRTCAHATPAPDGQWLCEFHNSYLTEAVQRVGCSDHRFIPVLLERIGELVDASQEQNWVRYRRKDGSVLINGEEGMSSAEIAARFVA